MTINGVIHSVDQTVEVTESFKKREFIVKVEYNPQYPEYLRMEMIQDKCSDLDSYNAGDYVDVSVNVKGRLYNDKNTGEERCFNTIQAWRISKVGTAPQSDTTEEAEWS